MSNNKFNTCFEYKQIHLSEFDAFVSILKAKYPTTLSGRLWQISAAWYEAEKRAASESFYGSLKQPVSFAVLVAELREATKLI